MLAYVRDKNDNAVICCIGGECNTNWASYLACLSGKQRSLIQITITTCGSRVLDSIFLNSKIYGVDLILPGCRLEGAATASTFGDKTSTVFVH